MLSRLGLGCFEWRILFGCRPSIVTPLRSTHTHHVTSIGRRRPEEPRDSPPGAAKDPSWVLLNGYGIRAEASFVADARTVAYSRTSTGHHLRVSLGRAQPPASSFVYYDFPDTAPAAGIEDRDDDVDEREKDGDADDEDDDGEGEEDCNVDDWRVSVVAAHGDSALLKMSNRRFPYGFEDEHFLYRAGAAGSPSMSPLPDRDFLTKSEQLRASPPIRPIVHSGTTALLRRGDGDGDGDALLVELDLKYDCDARRYTAEFCLLRLHRGGMPRWELKEPVPIVVHDQVGVQLEQLRGRYTTDTIPVGDRFLCWVTHESGFLLCDMADEAVPKVRYMPLPAGVIWDPKCYGDDDDDNGVSKHAKNLGAAGAGAVRFVSVEPHCCCGGPGRSTCARSRYAFTVRTWSTDLAMDGPTAWVEDGEIDCEEIWNLPGYEGLPRANLQCPVVSLDDPDVVCFLVSNVHFISSYEDRKSWMVQLNMKTKTLLSVAEFTAERWQAYSHSPARFLC